MEVRPTGRLGVPGTEFLAGSGSCLLQCVDWAASHLPISRDEAWSLASRRPAQFMGWSDRDEDEVFVQIKDGVSTVREVPVCGERVVG